MTSNWRHINLRQIKRLLQHLERTCMAFFLKLQDQDSGTKPILALVKVHHLKKIESLISLVKKNYLILQWMFHKLRRFRDWGRIHFSRLIMKLRGMRELLNCLGKERLEGTLIQKTRYQRNGRGHRLRLKLLKIASDFKKATKTTLAHGMGLTTESSTWPAKETFSQAEVVIPSATRLTAEDTEQVHFHHPLEIFASTPLVPHTNPVLPTEAASTQKHQKHSLKPPSSKTEPIKK